MQPVELDSIIARVNRTVTAEGRTVPYVFLEVIDPGTEAVKAADYHGLGYASGGSADITEFRFRGGGEPVHRRGRHSRGGAVVVLAAQLAADAVGEGGVFLQNHDTQRVDGVSYGDGALHRPANVWMLAQPYGYPVVMSSYALKCRGSQSGRDAGRRRAKRRCAARRAWSRRAGEWMCEHRDPWIVTMLSFRRAVAGTDFGRTGDNGANAMAFSRGDTGIRGHQCRFHRPHHRDTDRDDRRHVL